MPNRLDLPKRLNLKQAAELAGYRRVNTIRDLFLKTADERRRMKHAYNDLGETTVDTEAFVSELAKRSRDRAASGNWRLGNLERANEARRSEKSKIATRRK